MNGYIWDIYHLCVYYNLSNVNRFVRQENMTFI
jgi:hypothetical protein